MPEKNKLYAVCIREVSIIDGINIDIKVPRIYEYYIVKQHSSYPVKLKDGKCLKDRSGETPPFPLTREEFAHYFIDLGKHRVKGPSSKDQT